MYEIEKNLKIFSLQETIDKKAKNIIIIDDSTMTLVFSTMIRKSPCLSSSF